MKKTAAKKGNPELIEALNAIEKEKDISKEILLEAIENSLVAACKNEYGKADNIRVNLDRETGEFHVYQDKVVVEEVEDAMLEMSQTEAEVKYPGTGLGETVSIEVTPKNFGRIAAQKAKQVYGVEIVPAAIEDAKRNATLNHITNAEFFVGKAEEVLPEKYEKEGIYADVIVVDPPRKGCEESVLATMVKMQPKRIVYVSCDSATLARDLKYLRGEGYEVKKVQGVDQFPHTVHVETVVLLSQLKQKPDDYINVTI